MIAELSDDAKKKLIKRARGQISERNIEVPTDFGIKGMVSTVTDRVERPASMWLVHFSWKTASRYASYWEDYIPSRKVHASFLCGHEDKQDWAVRVPGTILTVQKALDWITPAVVKKAQAAQKKVFRQGDIYFVPMRISYHDMDVLYRGGTRHTLSKGINYDYGDRPLEITHPQHPTVKLEGMKNGYAWRAIRQTQLGNWGERVGAD